MKRRVFFSSILAACLILATFAAGSVLAQSGNTWHIDYYPNTDWSGNPVFAQDSPLIWFDWGTGAPGPNMPADNWTARMTTTAYYYSGVYRFTVQADDEAFLQVDNVTYLDTRGAGLAGKSFTIDIPFTQGNHYVRLDYREYTGTAYIFLTWAYLGVGPVGPTPPVGPSGVPTLPNSATSVQTKYGDYTPCIQQNLHQASCFVSDGQWDSPNQGSIQMEPKIEIWGNCTADQVQTFYIPSQNVTKAYKCSKTEAGWFPN